jgi:hypothetical protein
VVADILKQGPGEVDAFARSMSNGAKKSQVKVQFGAFRAVVKEKTDHAMHSKVLTQSESGGKSCLEKKGWATADAVFSQYLRHLFFSHL